MQLRLEWIRVARIFFTAPTTAVPTGVESQHAHIAVQAATAFRTALEESRFCFRTRSSVWTRLVRGDGIVQHGKIAYYFPYADGQGGSKCTGGNLEESRSFTFLRL